MLCSNTSNLNEHERLQEIRDRKIEAELKAQEKAGIDPVKSELADLLKNRECIEDAIVDFSESGLLTDLFVLMLEDKKDGSEASVIGRKVMKKILLGKANKNIEDQSGFYIADVEIDADYQQSLLSLEEFVRGSRKSLLDDCAADFSKVQAS